METLLKGHRRTMDLIPSECGDDIERMSQLMIKTLRQDGTIFTFGNGGSAADAQHLVCELTGRFVIEKRKPLPAVALCVNTSSLTSIGNDYSFNHIFARQVEALCRPGDFCLGISTSGNSENVHLALEAARSRGCLTGALLGKDGGRIRRVVDCSIVVPSDETPRIQEGHIFIIHLLCHLIDIEFTPSENQE